MPVLSSAEGPRPFTRRQALQNARFLDMLAQTGNARLAARRLGYNRSTFTKRRARDAAFAQGWEAALAAAHARFHLAGGTRPPEGDIRAKTRRRGEAGVAAPPRALTDAGNEGRAGLANEPHPSRTPAAPATRTGPSASPRLGQRPSLSRAPARQSRGANPSLRTQGGEPTIVRTRSGRLQLRLAPPGRMTRAAEQAFLRALSATANVRLSAAAAGFAHTSFYARARGSRAFAREMRLALEMGYDRLEAALLAAGLPDSHADDAWRHNDPPPIPPMTPDQALQLLCLHQKSVRQSWEQPHRRRRRGESDETHRERLIAMWTAEKRTEAEEAAVRRAERYEESGDWRLEDEPAPPDLPPLHLLTGWSRADPTKMPHDPKRALFGGWRLADWKKKGR